MNGKALIALGFILVLSQTPLTTQAETYSVPFDYSSIGSALESVQPGDRIEISPGVYSEFNLVMPENISLVGMGEEPSAVVIDGGGQGRIIQCEGNLQTSYLENLTLANGRATGPTIYDQSGGALMVSNSILRLFQCVFVNNQADSHGGAICSNYSSLIIIDCDFVGNSAPNGGGGAVNCSYGSSPLVQNCDFEDNTAAWGGAMSCRADSSPVVSDSRFIGNQAGGELGYGGAIFSDLEARPLFTNSTFFDNHAVYGGALASFQDAETNMEYCTVTGNSAEFRGAGLYCYQSSPRVTASIIAFQDGTGIAAQGGAVPMITCTDLFGNSDGDWVGDIADQGGIQNNLSADPIFCSENPGEELEFSLQDDSPCAPDYNTCGTLGAWPVGCALVPTQLSYFQVEWDGDHAHMSWQALSTAGTPTFRLTGALESESNVEWEIPFQNDGGGYFFGDDMSSLSTSGESYVFRLYLIDSNGDVSLLSEARLVSVPNFPGIRDLKAWPNPFNPLTSISFNLGQSQKTRVSIYSVDGRRVKTLASRVFQSGPHEIKWDGTDDSGHPMGTGAYIALVEGEYQMQTIKLTMLK